MKRMLTSTAVCFALMISGCGQDLQSQPTPKPTVSRSEKAKEDAEREAYNAQVIAKAQAEANLSTPTPTPAPTADVFTTSDKAFTVTTDPKEKVEQYGLKYITGSVRNNTDQEVSAITVEISLYDDSGALIGSTADFATGLDPKGTWKFKAIVTKDNVAKFKVKSVTGI